MPITLGGRTYSDDEVRQFYANGGNEAAFAQQNGLSDAEAQSAMSQARNITSSPASPAPASSPITMDQIQSAWNANKDDPQKVYNLMMQHGASYRDVSKAAGMSPEQLNKYLAMPIANDTSHPYQLNYRGVPVNSQGMEVDVSGDPNWRSKVDMRHADPHFGYNDPGYGKADDPFAMDGYSAFYNGMGGSGPRPGSNNIGGRPRQYTGETNRPGYYVAPGAGVYWQQNGQADPGTPRPQQSQSFTGVNSVDHNKGVFSPTENRWISNDEIKQYFNSNPGASADQINGMAGKLGLNPYAINYAAWQGTGGGDPRNNQQFLKLGAQLDASQYRGSSGYGVDLDAAHRAGSDALVAGAGNVQYQMPNGSYHSVRVHNGRPDQTYEQVLGNLGSLVGGSQPAGIINSAAGQLSQGDQSPPTVVADGGQYLPDGTWSDLVNGKHTGTISPGTYAQSKIGSF